MTEQSDIYDYDSDNVLDEVVAVLQARTDWHGFRGHDEVAERFDAGEVSWVHYTGDVVCAATYRHLTRSHTRVYFTGMRDGAWYPQKWQSMIRGVLLESPHDRLITKTPVDCREAELWDEVGTRVRLESGKERQLGVWETTLDTPHPLKEW